MTTFALTKTRTDARTGERTPAPTTTGTTRLERRWFKMEGRLECRYVMVQA